MTTVLATICHTKTKLYREEVINRKDCNKNNTYKIYRNKFSATIRAAKATYFNDFVTKHKKDCGIVWKIINSSVGSLIKDKRDIVNKIMDELNYCCFIRARNN